MLDGDSDSEAVVCALIGLMEDSDPVVRTRFSQSVRFLLTETTRNSEQGSLSEVSDPVARLKHLCFTLSFSKNLKAIIFHYKYIVIRQKEDKIFNTISFR